MLLSSHNLRVWNFTTQYLFCEVHVWTSYIHMKRSRSEFSPLCSAHPVQPFYTTNPEHLVSAEWPVSIQQFSTSQHGKVHWKYRKLSVAKMGINWDLPVNMCVYVCFVWTGTLCLLAVNGSAPARVTSMLFFALPGILLSFIRTGDAFRQLGEKGSF